MTGSSDSVPLSSPTLPGALPPGGSAAPARYIHALLPRVCTHRPLQEPGQMQPLRTSRVPLHPPGKGGRGKRVGGFPRCFGGFPDTCASRPPRFPAVWAKPTALARGAAEPPATPLTSVPVGLHAVPVLQPVTPGTLVASGGAQALPNPVAPLEAM